IDDRRPKWPHLFAGGEFDLEAGERFRRMLAQDRSYSTFEGVGTEPLADWMYRLATVPMRRGPYAGDRLPLLQRLLDKESAKVMKWFSAAGRPVRVPVYCGLYPTGDF